MNEIITQTKGYLEEVKKKYPTNRDAIAVLKEKYMKLKIEGLNDKAGYATVHTARMDMKNRRIALDKSYKQFNEEAKIFTTGIRTEKNELIELCEPIEKHLQDMEKVIDDEKLRIKNEVAEKAQEKIRVRIKSLYDLGAVFDGFNYVYRVMFGENIEFEVDQIKGLPDNEFDDIVSELTNKITEERAAKAEIERKKKDEADQLKKDQEKLKAESEKLATERLKLREKQEKGEAELKAKRDKLEADKQAVEKTKQDAIDKKTREEELEKATKEAAEKAVKEKEEKEKLKAEDEAEKERIAKLEAELAEKLKPDNEKLLALADLIAGTGMPSLETEQAHETLVAAQGHLHRATQILRQGA